MKVLIIGIPRSGTTSLLNSFENQGYVKINEPYNYNIKKSIKYDNPPKEVLEQDNIIVKTNVTHIPYKWKQDWYTFIIEFVKYFDKVILLDRLQFEEHLMSIMHLHFRIFKGKSVLQKWSLNDIDSNFIAGYLAAEGDKILKRDKEQLKRLSEELNIPITYYEDLYSEDRIKVFELINKWDLNIDPFEVLDYLDPSKKLKQADKKSII